MFYEWIKWQVKCLWKDNQFNFWDVLWCVWDLNTVTHCAINKRKLHIVRKRNIHQENSPRRRAGSFKGTGKSGMV